MHTGDAEKTSSWSGLYIEKWCQFDKELAVMVARNSKGEVRIADGTTTMHTVHTQSHRSQAGIYKGDRDV